MMFFKKQQKEFFGIILVATLGGFLSQKTPQNG